MATQMHVAYSSKIMGVGMIAGAPYYCARGSSVIGAGPCANNPDNIPINVLVDKTNEYVASGAIDVTSNMENDMVFVFAGYQDTVVAHGVADKVVEYYSHFVKEENIKLVKIDAEHTVPTENYGNACSYKGSPFIGRCSYDGAYEILNHIYGGLTRPTAATPQPGDFYMFDQSEFFYISPPITSSMDNTGYVYVPSGCMSGANVCRLHVAYHGCQQGRHTLGDEFPRKGGYNEVGELNNIIILYPQATATGVNPLGCWDWWGYTINDYATKVANQLLAVDGMVDRIS